MGGAALGRDAFAQHLQRFARGARELGRAGKGGDGEAPRLRRQAGMIGRINGLITLVIVLCAVIVVRGC